MSNKVFKKDGKFGRNVIRADGSVEFVPFMKPFFMSRIRFNKICKSRLNEVDEIYQQGRF